MTRSKASLLLFALTGCLHRSPDAAVLALLVPYFTEEHNDQSNQPEYIVFADQLTATVFESLKRNPHYRISPMGTQLVCPSDPAAWPHSYLLGARVFMLTGDSAIAMIEQTCSRLNSRPGEVVIGGTIVYSDNFLLRRRGGKWRVEKHLDGSIAVPM